MKPSTLRYSFFVALSVVSLFCYIFLYAQTGSAIAFEADVEEKMEQESNYSLPDAAILKELARHGKQYLKVSL